MDGIIEALGKLTGDTSKAINLADHCTRVGDLKQYLLGLHSVTHENDVTYFYFFGHSGWGDKTYCLYSSISIKKEALLTYLNAINGQVILITDTCFGGHYVEIAQDMKLDKDHMNILVSTSSNDVGNVAMSVIAPRPPLLQNLYDQYLLDGRWNNMMNQSTDFGSIKNELSTVIPDQPCFWADGFECFGEWASGESDNATKMANKAIQHPKYYGNDTSTIVYEKSIRTANVQ